MKKEELSKKEYYISAKEEDINKFIYLTYLIEGQKIILKILAEDSDNFNEELFEKNKVELLKLIMELKLFAVELIKIYLPKECLEYNWIVKAVIEDDIFSFILEE